MRVVYADEFQKRFQRPPSEIRRLYQAQEARFINNWREHRLHIKKLKGHPLAFSFRITRNYRVLFILIDSETELFATIGHRRDIYRQRK